MSIASLSIDVVPRQMVLMNTFDGIFWRLRVRCWIFRDRNFLDFCILMGHDGYSKGECWRRLPFQWWMIECRLLTYTDIGQYKALLDWRGLDEVWLPLKHEKKNPFSIQKFRSRFRIETLTKHNLVKILQALDSFIVTAPFQPIYLFPESILHFFMPCNLHTIKIILKLLHIHSEFSYFIQHVRQKDTRCLKCIKKQIDKVSGHFLLTHPLLFHQL